MTVETEKLDLAQEDHQLHLGQWQVIGQPIAAGEVLPTEASRRSPRQIHWLHKQLVAAEMRQALDELIPIVAHEVNNALTVLIGNVQLVDYSCMDAETNFLLAKVDEEARRIMRVIRNLLTFTQDSTTMPVYVDVNTLLSSILDLLSYHLRINNIELETWFDPELPPTLGDVYQLRYLFFHLISNVTEGLSGNHHLATLSVSTASKGNALDITIGNNRLEVLSTATPVHSTADDELSHLGSDLFLCYNIVRQHGGKLQVASYSGGLRVLHVELPVAEWPSLTVSDPAAEPGEARAGTRILMADDEREITALVSRVLIADGCEVDTVHDGKAALAKLQAHDYDLVLLNVRMPETDGQQVYEHLRSMASDRARRVIFITGDTCQPETMAFLEATGNPYITKPFELDALKTLIWRTLAESAEQS